MSQLVYSYSIIAHYLLFQKIKKKNPFEYASKEVVIYTLCQTIVLLFACLLWIVKLFIVTCRHDIRHNTTQQQ